MFHRAMSRRHWTVWQGWVVVLMVGGIMTIAQSSDDQSVTTTVHFPFAKGVYNELRTQGDVKIGSIAAPGPGDPSARLYVIDAGGQPALRVDDVPSDPSPFLIDDAGRIGIGTTLPSASDRLDVQGAARITGNVHLGVHVDADGTVRADGTGALRCAGCIDRVDVNSAEVQLRVQSSCPVGQAVQEVLENGQVRCIQVTRQQ